MRLSLVFWKQMKHVPVLPARDSEEAMHENFLLSWFSGAHSGMHGVPPTSVTPASSLGPLAQKQGLDPHPGPGSPRLLHSLFCSVVCHDFLLTHFSFCLKTHFLFFLLYALSPLSPQTHHL